MKKIVYIMSSNLSGYLFLSLMLGSHSRKQIYPIFSAAIFLSPRFIAEALSFIPCDMDYAPLFAKRSL